MSFSQQEIDQAMERIIKIARENMLKEQNAQKGSSSNAHKLSCKTMTLKTKKTIPSTIKRLVWHAYIGEDKGKAKCLCCKTTDITQLSFHCGHVIPEAHGGCISVENLRPICQNCNSSMGTMNMTDFMTTYKI
jgi:5-methylcytosine-specific restriction endonuclease McrA